MESCRESDSYMGFIQSPVWCISWDGVSRQKCKKPLPSDMTLIYLLYDLILYFIMFIGYQDSCYLQTVSNGSIWKTMWCWRVESYYQLWFEFSNWYESTHQPCIQNGVHGSHINNWLWVSMLRQHVLRHLLRISERSTMFCIRHSKRPASLVVC